VGSVEEVRLPPKGNEKDVAHLLLKSGAERLTRTCVPKRFSTIWVGASARAMQSASLDQVSKQSEGEWILAREIVRGTDALVRDAKVIQFGVIPPGRASGKPVL